MSKAQMVAQGFRKGRETYRIPGDPRVIILLLNWNGWRDTIECLESLYAIDYPYYDVAVIDNGSSDASVDKIKKWAKGTSPADNVPPNAPAANKIKEILEYNREEAERGGDGGKKSHLVRTPSTSMLIIIKNEGNLGFAEGNNVGIKYALNTGYDYILLLNNDTVVGARFLTELIGFAEHTPKAGIFGPKVYYHSQTDRIWFAGGEISWWRGKTRHLHAHEIDCGQADDAREVDYIVGCSLLIKREVIEEIGLLDRIYFTYFEDIDWCWRAKQKGYKIYYVPGSEVWHKISSTSAHQSDFYNYYFARNRVIFFNKYGPGSNPFFIYLYQVLLKSIAAFVIFGLKNKSLKSALAYARGCINGLRYNPAGDHIKYSSS